MPGFVAENQLSGYRKEGQNARLAAKHRMEIDIKSQHIEEKPEEVTKEDCDGPKRIPMRMCLGCREMMPKKEMTRIVRTVEGNIEIDYTGKKSGRSAYFCKNPECLDKALKKTVYQSFGL